MENSGEHKSWKENLNPIYITLEYNDTLIMTFDIE